MCVVILAILMSSWISLTPFARLRILTVCYTLTDINLNGNKQPSFTNKIINSLRKLAKGWQSIRANGFAFDHWWVLWCCDGIIMSFMGLSLQVHREIKSYTTHCSENKVDQIYFIEGNCGRVEANLDRTLWIQCKNTPDNITK